MQFFFKNFTHILKRTQLKKFEDLFLVKIANKGTSLRPSLKLSDFFYRIYFLIDQIFNIFQQNCPVIWL